ncbi:MAG: MarR family transcriptional regulator [Armatimonadetes bacterium]|nr:MarR family transcriptional regulator [Armatimonadota bacterium]
MSYALTLSMRVWLSTLRMTMSVRRCTRAMFQEYDLSGPQFGVLRVLHAAGADGLKLSEVSDALHVTCGNITSLVDGLEQRGLVVREPHPGDRRVVMARLTQSGTEVFNELAPRYSERIDGIMSCLTAEEQETLADLLDRVAEHVAREE